MPQFAARLCVAAIASGAALVCFSFVQPTYDELEAELMAAQNSSPASALNLAETLMREYPSRCMPYQIAANVHTLEKNYMAAESVLQTAIEKCAAPPELYIRLAHFYQRVMPEKGDRKIAELRDCPAVRRSPLLTARLLCIGGHWEQAVQYLENAPRTFETMMMLSGLYAEQKAYDHAGRLLMEIPDILCIGREQQVGLLAAMLSLPAPFDRRQTGFCLDLILKTAVLKAGYEPCRRDISEKLDKLMSRAPDRHTAALLQAGLGRNDPTDLHVWLSAIYLQKIERADTAYEMLKGYENNDARVLEEKARLAVNCADVDEIGKSWRRLLAIRPDDIRIRLAYAQILNRSGLIAQSRQVTADIEPGNIPESLCRPYYSLCFDNEAALEDFNALVDTWIQAGKFYRYGDFLLFKDILFSRLPETAQHRRLLKALDAKRTETLTENAAVDVLRMFIAEQLRDMDLYFASADAFLSRRTICDARTIDDLVQHAINTALSSYAPGDAAETGEPDPVSQAMRFAAKWSACLVEQHPDKPAYQVNLIISDHIQGKIRNLEERCDSLFKGNEAYHRQLERVARMLFRIGRYELSAGYYQKAMDRRPDILRYRLGHADCLLRLQRYRQAGEFYTRMLTHPTTALSWDVETLLDRLWVCYEKPGMADEFLDVIETLKTHSALDADTLREAAGILFLKKGRFRAAEKQLTEYLQNAPADENRYGVSLKLAACHAVQNDWDAAIRLYNECLRRYTGDVLKTIDCLYNRAEMKRRKGDYQAAIEDWKRIAERFPTDEVAAEAMLAAASAARDSLRDLPQARQLYAACLKLARPHSPMARIAEEKLAAMGGPW